MNILKKINLKLSRKRFYSKSQYWTREEINAHQDKKLIEIVQHAAEHVPYYRDLFKNIDFDPKTFRGRQDIEKIPLLDKETLRTRYKEFIADNASKYGIIWHKTSGSTGTPLNMALDNYSIANKWAATARAYNWTGYNLGNKIFYIKGLADDRKKDYCFRLKENSLNFHSSSMSVENCRKVHKLLMSQKPQYYSGYARSILLFAQILKQEGLKLPNPKAILCFGETVTSDMRQKLELTYNAQVFDFYGHTENAVLVCESPLHNKYLVEDYFYPELIDEKGIVTLEKRGELVGTSFYNYAMPLIRYKTRDYITLATKKAEENINFKTVHEIEGRKDDYITTPDGRTLFLAEGAINYAQGIVTAQYIQEQPDTLIINLVTDSTFETKYFDDIKVGLVARFGKDMNFEFRVVDQLEQSRAGKTPFIINRLKK